MARKVKTEAAQDRSKHAAAHRSALRALTFASLQPQPAQGFQKARWEAVRQRRHRLYRRELICNGVALPVTPYGAECSRDGCGRKHEAAAHSASAIARGLFKNSITEPGEHRISGNAGGVLRGA